MTILSVILAATLHTAPGALAAAAWTAPLPPPPPVVANEGAPGSTFHYDNVDGAVVLGDYYGLRGAVSWHLSGPWIGLGRLEYLTDDGGDTNVDVFNLSGGVGFVQTLGATIDLIGSAELEWSHAEFDTPAGCSDDDDLGLRFRGGARYLIADRIELAGGVSYSTIFDEDLRLDLQALYAFTERFSGFVGVDYRDDAFATLGVRYGF